MRRRSTFVAVTAAGLLLTGCATKDWVRDMMGKAAADTDSKIGEQKIRVEGMGFRMAKVEEQATKAGERADAAHARAEAAHVRADGVDERLTRLWSSRHKRQDVESMDVTFGFDRWELDDGAQTTLLGFVGKSPKTPETDVAHFPLMSSLYGDRTFGSTSEPGRVLNRVRLAELAEQDRRDAAEDDVLDRGFDRVASAPQPKIVKCTRIDGVDRGDEQVPQGDRREERPDDSPRCCPASRCART